MATGIKLEIEGGIVSCPILIGPGLLGKAVLPPARAGSRAFLVSDEAVYAHYGKKLSEAIGSSGYEVVPARVPRGERAKTFHHLRLLCLKARKAGLERNSPVLALGGGAVTDLAGFFASVYLRGLPLYNFSTTVLGQVDAAFGGKTAINLEGAKNQVGAFFQPQAVFCDLDTLETLSAREYRNGLAEIIKCGVIADPDLFKFLENNTSSLLARDSRALEVAVSAAVKVKAAVVSEDPFEKLGRREVLNFGHTIGHGLESAGGNRRLKHGEAVAVGMICESSIARRLGIFSGEDSVRLGRLVSSFGLPVSAAGLELERVRQALFYDKKKKDGKLAFVLPSGIGKTVTRRDVPEKIISASLEEALA